MARTANGLSGMTTAEIHRELRKRSSRANALVRRRNALLAKVERLERQIEEFGGDVGGGRGGRGQGLTARGTPRKRMKNEVNLVEALANTLKNKTMGVTEVAEAVLQNGYKTTAANFRTIVNQALIKNRKMFKKVSRGQYTAS